MASQRRTCTKGRSVVLKITSVRTAVVEANYDWTFIRVCTDEGIVGLGESFLAPGLTGINRDLKPLLTGEDPRNVDKLCSKMRWAASGAGSMGGIVYNAISGIEAALWDIVAPDRQKVGGLLEGRKISDMADTHYVAVAPHCIASPVGTIASVHVATAIPNFLALEWHGLSVPFWEDMVVGFDGPVIEDGYIKVPQAPGLGVDLNEEVAREYALEGEPFFEE